MMRLINFELEKIWRNKKLLCLLALLLITNVGFQWYVNRPSDMTPSLKSYRLAAEKTATMTEQEKLKYLQETKEMLEKCYSVYTKGDYLVYTDSIEKEMNLIDELYEEALSVTNYPEYLREMKDSGNILNEISIFSDTSAKHAQNFSGRNIEKSGNDYKNRTDSNVKWIPSKGITSAMDNQITIFLLFIASFLLALWVILDEKEKGLFFVTRTTKNGALGSIAARITALFLSCIIFSALIYGSSCIFYCFTSGLGDLSLDIQSVSAYMQSCYSLNICQYILLSVFVKAVVIFCFGLFLQLIAIICRKKIMPFLLGIIVIAGSALMYSSFPAVGVLNCFKYSNIIGFIHTENLFGDYLNYDIGGYPISRTGLSIMLLAVLTIVFAILVSVSFCRSRNLYFIQNIHKIKNRYRPHVSLLRHEGYKIFIANHAIYVIIACIIAAGYYNCTQSYLLSAQEQYYKNLMANLEGKLNGKKETLILSEKKRFEDAIKEIDKIDELAAQGKLDYIQAEEQKDVLNATLVFYQTFKRALRQYDYIKKNGGNFVYDTGYMYLLGIWGDNFLITLVIFTICLLLVFSGSVSMEYSNHSNLLIGSSKTGMKTVIRMKIKLCILSGVFLPACIYGVRLLHINKALPLHYPNNGIHILSVFNSIPVNMPIWCLVLLSLISQIFVCSLLAISILLLSYWRKNYMQAMVIGAVVFLVPMILYMQGIEFMKYLTVYPVFAWYA